MPARRLLSVLFVSSLGATGCSAGGPIEVAPRESVDAGPFALSGYVLKGPVSGATVTAFKLHSDLSRGDALASATTDESGFYGLTLPPYNGDVLLVATGGSYAEEAVPLDEDGKSPRLTLDRDFLGVALDVQTGQPATSNVTPVSHWAVHLARFHAAHGQHGHAALVEAFAHLNAHFGNGPGITPELDWQSIVFSAHAFGQSHAHPRRPVSARSRHVPRGGRLAGR